MQTFSYGGRETVFERPSSQVKKQIKVIIERKNDNTENITASTSRRSHNHMNYKDMTSKWVWNLIQYIICICDYWSTKGLP